MRKNFPHVDESHESTAAYITMMLIEQLDINHSDLAGRFPTNQPRETANYHGYIHLEPMNSRNGASYVQAYRVTLEYYAKHGHHPTMQRADNETSGQLERFL